MANKPLKTIKFPGLNDIYTVLQASNLAPNYNNSSTYKVGDLVSYDNKLYRCNIDIDTAETWTSSHWIDTNISSSIDDLIYTLNKLCSSNMPFYKSNLKVETSKSSWANKVVTTLYPSNNSSVYIKWDTVVAETSLPTNLIQVRYFDTNGQSLGNNWVTINGATAQIPDNTERIDIAVYTNNATASNSYVEYTGLTIYYDYGVLKQKLNNTVLLGDYSVEELLNVINTFEENDTNLQTEIVTTSDRLDMLRNDNVLLYESSITIKTSKSTWSKQRILLTEDINFTSLFITWSTVTSNGSSLPVNLIQVVFVDANDSNINTFWVTVKDSTITLPSGTNKIYLDFYTNNGTAVNTSITYKKFMVSFNSRLKQSLNDTVLLGDYKVEDISALAKNYEDSLYPNTLYHIDEQTFTTAKATWQYKEVNISLPSEINYLGLTLGSVETDSGTLPGNIIRYMLYKGTEQVGNTLWSTRPGSTFININQINKIPDRLNISFYTNNATAINTSITIKDFYIYTDVNLIDTQLDTVDVISNKTHSKNLLTSKFYRGSISSNTGEFVESNAATNSSTKDLIPVKPNTKYTFSWKWNDKYTTLRIYYYNANGELISDEYAYDGWTKRIGYFSFITGATTYFIRIMYYSNESTNYDQIFPKETQLEFGAYPTTNQANYDLSYLVDYEKVRNSKLIVPDYYFENNYIDGKIDFIKQLMFDANGNYDAFIFITDMHWNINAQKSPALIRYLYNNLKINRLFNGGDMYDIWSEYGGHDECIRMIESAFPKSIYNVVGNHEFKGTSMTDTKVWYYLNGNQTNIVVGDFSRSYYYFDNEMLKIRYIVLNIYSDNGAEPKVYFETAQANWFRDVALNMETGWIAIVFSHAFYDISISVRQRMNISGVTDVIFNIVDSYSGNGQIACLIQGHTHTDRITSTPGGIPIVITTCDKNGIWTSPDGYEDLIQVRNTDTIRQGAFDVAVVDRTNNKITFTRIGCPALNGVDDETGTEVEYRTVNI